MLKALHLDARAIPLKNQTERGSGSDPAEALFAGLMAQSALAATTAPVPPTDRRSRVEPPRTQSIEAQGAPEAVASKPSSEPAPPPGESSPEIAAPQLNQATDAQKASSKDQILSGEVPQQSEFQNPAPAITANPIRVDLSSLMDPSQPSTMGAVPAEGLPVKDPLLPVPRPSMEAPGPISASPAPMDSATVRVFPQALKQTFVQGNEPTPTESIPGDGQPSMQSKSMKSAGVPVVPKELLGTPAPPQDATPAESLPGKHAVLPQTGQIADVPSPGPERTAQAALIATAPAVVAREQTVALGNATDSAGSIQADKPLALQKPVEPSGSTSAQATRSALGERVPYFNAEIHSLKLSSDLFKPSPSEPLKPAETRSPAPPSDPGTAQNQSRTKDKELEPPSTRVEPVSTGTLRAEEGAVQTHKPSEPLTGVQAPPIGEGLRTSNGSLPQVDVIAPRASPVFNQVEGSIRWILQNKSQGAELQLHPDSLGRVTIQLRVEGQEVHARLWASEASSVPILQEHKALLEASLREQGLKLGSFDLQFGARHDQAQTASQERNMSTVPNRLPTPEMKQEIPSIGSAEGSLDSLDPHQIEVYA
jgi:flagellar hook-length control protein FliK